MLYMYNHQGDDGAEAALRGLQGAEEPLGTSTQDRLHPGAVAVLGAAQVPAAQESLRRGGQVLRPRDRRARGAHDDPRRQSDATRAVHAARCRHQLRCVCDM